MRLIARNNTRPVERGEAVSLLSTWGSQTPAGPLNDFQDYVSKAYQRNGIVYALIAARTKLMSEARFIWRNMSTNALFPTAALGLLERPWPGGTTGKLITEIETDVFLAGNAYIHRTPNGLQRLRPDWVKIVANPDGADIAGYLYDPQGGLTKRTLILPDDMAHVIDQKDPLHPWRGMSCLTPIARQILVDDELEQHKRSFLQNSATPNMIVKVDQALSPDDRRTLEDAVARRHTGPRNAWRTMIVDRGADVSVVGKDMREIAFVDLSAETEARICQAASTPPVIVGAQKGLDASTYSNFTQAFRLWVDLTIRPRWTAHAGGLDVLFRPGERPAVSELTYDDRRVPALQEDAKEAAEIHDLQSRTLGALIRAGYTPESSVLAVVDRDLTKLEHTGLIPNSLMPAEGGEGEGPDMDPEDGQPGDPQADRSHPKGSPRLAAGTDRHLPAEHDQSTHGRKGGATLQFESLDDAVAWGESRGIAVSFGPNAVTVQGAQATCQAVEDMIAKYPHLSGSWGDEHPNGFYRNRERGIKEVELGAVVSFGAAAEVGPVRNFGADPASVLKMGIAANVTPENIARLKGMSESGQSIPNDTYSAAIHEMGHAVHFSLGNFNPRMQAALRVGEFDKVVNGAARKVWGRGTDAAAQKVADLSAYSITNTTEFFAEAFAARNVPAIYNSLNAGARSRLDAFADLVNSEARTVYGIEGDTI